MRLHRLIPVAKCLVAVAAVLVAAGCYMPLRFDAELELERTGHYNFIFDGYIAKVDLYDDLRQGKITPAEERERVAVIERDIKRDPAATEVKYFKKGVFKVHWERKGDLVAAKSVTFLRRNEHMLGISYNSETGQISLLGKSLKRDTKNQLREMGLDTHGQLRVITDAKVVGHNASSVKKFRRKSPRHKMYTWKIPNILAPTQALKIQLR